MYVHMRQLRIDFDIEYHRNVKSTKERKKNAQCPIMIDKFVVVGEGLKVIALVWAPRGNM